MVDIYTVIGQTGSTFLQSECFRSTNSSKTFFSSSSLMLLSSLQIYCNRLGEPLIIRTQQAELLINWSPNSKFQEF